MLFHLCVKNIPIFTKLKPLFFFFIIYLFYTNIKLRLDLIKKNHNYKS